MDVSIKEILALCDDADANYGSSDIEDGLIEELTKKVRALIAALENPSEGMVDTVSIAIMSESSARSTEESVKLKTKAAIKAVAQYLGGE